VKLSCLLDELLSVTIAIFERDFDCKFATIAI